MYVRYDMHLNPRFSSFSPFALSFPSYETVQGDVKGPPLLFSLLASYRHAMVLLKKGGSPYRTTSWQTNELLPFMRGGV